MRRIYTDYSPYGSHVCEHEGCDAAAKHVVEYDEDASYRYMDRWIKSTIHDVGYYCDMHLPVEARELAAGREG